VKRLQNKFECTKIQRRFESYRNGIVHPRNKFVDLILKLEQCRNNCSSPDVQCDFCFGDGCIQPNNSNIKPKIVTSRVLPISLILLAFALFLAVSGILAYYCEGERVGRLDLVQSESDRRALEKFIQNNFKVAMTGLKK